MLCCKFYPSRRASVLDRVGSATLLGLLISCCAAPQPPPIAEAPPVATEAQTDSERPLALWEVRREGLESSWLFGTCHAGVLLEESLPASRRELVEQASLFVMEVDSETMDPAWIMEQLMLPEGQTLETLLGVEQWTEFTEALELPPAAADTLNQMHPFALYGLVINQMANEEVQVAPADFVPMDFVLSELATENGVGSAFLETVEEQMALFLGMEMSFWTDGIETLISPEGRQALRDSLDDALDVCRTGDASRFLASQEGLEGASQSFNDQLINQRNQNWIGPLEAYFEGGGVFVAVGAAHLVGDAGVVPLLRARGWTVVQQTGITAEHSAPADPL